MQERVIEMEKMNKEENQVYLFLKKENMERNFEKLFINGFDTLQKLHQLRNISDVNKIGVEVGDQDDLLASIRHSRGLQNMRTFEFEPKNCIQIQLLSDLHLEFPGALEELGEIPVKAPVLALLGDIGVYNCEESTYKRFVLEQADRFQLVLLIAGNHECKTAFHFSFILFLTLCNSLRKIMEAS